MTSKGMSAGGRVPLEVVTQLGCPRCLAFGHLGHPVFVMGYELPAPGPPTYPKFETWTWVLGTFQTR